MKRPRRQNFLGELMENGAFYINTVGNILKMAIVWVGKSVSMRCRNTRQRK